MNYDKLIEKTKSSELIYDGVVIHLYKDTVILPDGSEGIREYSKHIGAVAVLPLWGDGTVSCVRQYRYAHRKVMLEIPAGKRDDWEENPITGALRELREETGCTCKKLYSMGIYDSTPALFDEKIWLYLATDLTPGNQDLDEDEFLTVERIPLDKLCEMVMSGEITDGKTQVSVLKAVAMKNNNSYGENLL